jgi:hypothetical protein
LLITLFILVQGYFFYTLLKPSSNSKQPDEASNLTLDVVNRPIHYDSASFEYEAKSNV